MRRSVLLFSIVIIFCQPLSLGAIIKVPDDYPRISIAVNNAIGGDTILVADGEYYDNISFKGKNIVLSSYFIIDGNSKHIRKTIINGAARGTVLTIKNGETTSTTIIGLSITNGRSNKGYTGAGISLHDAGEVKISNCTITENTTDGRFSHRGAGLYSENSTVIIDDVEISNNIIKNKGNNFGAGIYSLESHLTLVNSKVVYNNLTSSDHASFGAGIYAKGADPNFGSLIIKNSKINNNSINAKSTAAGGGIFASTTQVSLMNVKIKDNNVITHQNKAIGGGAFLSGVLTIAESLFVGNNYCKSGLGAETFSKGGGLYLSGEFSLSNSTIKENICDAPYTNEINNVFGGGLYIAGNKSAQNISNVEVKNNQVRSNLNTTVHRALGAGIFVERALNLSFNHINIIGNTANESDDGIYYLNSSSGLINSFLVEGKADNEYAIYLDSTNPPSDTNSVFKNTDYYLGYAKPLSRYVHHYNLLLPIRHPKTYNLLASLKPVLLVKNYSRSNFVYSNSENNFGVSNWNILHTFNMSNKYWRQLLPTYQQHQISLGLEDDINGTLNISLWSNEQNVNISSPPVIDILKFQNDLESMNFDWEGTTSRDLSSFKMNYDTTSSEYSFTNELHPVTGNKYHITNIPTGQEYGFGVTIEDKDGNELFYSNLVNVVTNVPPVISSIPDTFMGENDSLRIKLQATDAENNTLAYHGHLSNDAIQMEINENELLLIPDVDWYGNAEITVVGSDGFSMDSTSFILTVNPVNNPPRPFSLLSPKDTTVVIDEMTRREAILFQWEQTDDVDNLDITYGFSSKGIATDRIINQVRSSRALLDLEMLAESLPGPGEYSGTWTIYATDGIDTTYADNGPRPIIFRNTIDTIAPVLEMGVLANTAPADSMNLYIFANEVLDSIPNLSLHNTTIEMQQVREVIPPLYHASIHSDQVGNHTLTATASDTSGNLTQQDFSFAVGKIRPSSISTIQIPSTNILVDVSDKTLPEESYLFGFQLPKNINNSRLKSLYPSMAPIDKSLTLKEAFIYEGQSNGGNKKTILKVQEENLTQNMCIYQSIGQVWKPVPTFINPEGNLLWAYTDESGIFGVFTGGQQARVLSSDLKLFPNYPNPFRQNTTIEYVLPMNEGFDNQDVNLQVLNIRGEVVKVLVHEKQTPQQYSLNWDGTNSLGIQVSAGLYFLRLNVNENIKVQKMVKVN